MMRQINPPYLLTPTNYYRSKYSVQNMKPNKISYLLLSLTRISGTGNGSGTYSLGQTLPGITKIKLQHMSFYNMFYNVSSTNNLLPSIITGGTTYPGVAIPVGIYSMPSFAVALQTALNSQGSGLAFTTTYNELTQTISISAGSAFQLLSGSSRPSMLRQYKCTPQE